MSIKKIKSKIDNNFVYYCDLFIIYLTYNNEFIHEIKCSVNNINNTSGSCSFFIFIPSAFAYINSDKLLVDRQKDF